MAITGPNGRHETYSDPSNDQDDCSRLFFAALLLQTSAHAQGMEISPNGSRPAAIAPTEHFVGTATLEPLFGEKPTMPATGGLITFVPGAHSDWHTHPAGQLLIVIAGTGWVQERRPKT